MLRVENQVEQVPMKLLVRLQSYVSTTVLVSWAFEESAVRAALEAAGGDKEAAVNILLG